MRKTKAAPALRHRWKLAARKSSPKGFRLLVAFCEAVDEKSIPQTDLTLQIRDRFDAILLGGNPIDAFDLKKPTRVASNEAWEYKLKIAIALLDEKNANPKFTNKQIIGKVADRFGRRDSTVKKISIDPKLKGLATSLRWWRSIKGI